LADDDRADEKADEGAHVEDEADGRADAPVVLLVGDVLGAGQQLDAGGERGQDFLAGSLGVGAGFEADEPEVDDPRLAAGHQAQGIHVAGDQVAVGGKGDPEGEGAAHLDAPAGDLVAGGLAGRETFPE